MPNRNTVTIVVPVYGDLPSLEQCIESLKKHVSRDHKVIFVNDCGPEVEKMEEAILRHIKGLSNFEYHRNDQNLGFIKTCNRAVFELDGSKNDILLLNSDTVATEGFIDEMLGVLYASDKHGVVCPRSSNATIASVPFRMMNNTPDRELEYAWNAYQKVKDMLPRFIVTPVAVGFCFLARRTLIDNFGLFDEIYGLGYSEENDFCLRINKYGYSSVMANHAFVYHLESKSFTSEKKAKLVAENEATMIQRYPYYRQLVQRYVDSYIDPIDWFADVIINKSSLKVMIDLFHLPLAFNGTSRNSISLLEYLKNHQQDFPGVEFTVVAQKDAVTFHNLDQFGFRVVHPGELNEIFHVGYCPSQIFHLENLMLLNKHCLKVVFSHLDIIAVRNNELLASNFRVRALFADSFMLADKIITISDFTKDDTLAYFGVLTEGHEGKFTTIHQGYPGQTFKEQTTTIDLDTKSFDIDKNRPYILVFGNDFSHKLIREVLPHLREVDMNVVLVGPSHIASYEKEGHVTLLPSGNLSDSFIDRLYEGCSAVIFPSAYEGFGLPVAEAAYFKKPIILNKTAVSQEIAGLYDKYISTYYFESLKDIPAIVKQAVQEGDTVTSVPDEALRTLDDYNRDVLELLVATAKDEAVEPIALRRRWYYFANVSEYAEGSVRVKKSLVERTANRLRKYPQVYNFARRNYRKYLKNR